MNEQTDKRAVDIAAISRALVAAGAVIKPGGLRARISARGDYDKLSAVDKARVRRAVEALAALAVQQASEDAALDSLVAAAAQAGQDAHGHARRQARLEHLAGLDPAEVAARAAAGLLSADDVKALAAEREARQRRALGPLATAIAYMSKTPHRWDGR